MVTRESFDYIFKGNLKKLQKEAVDTILFLQDNEIYLESLFQKLQKLNYFENYKNKFWYTSKSGIKMNMNLTGVSGYHTPFVKYTSNQIEDYVIFINKNYSNLPENKVHEFLHFLSTEDKKANKICDTKIKTGITFLGCNFKDDAGIIAINEAITQYYTFRICGKCYDKKYYRLYNKGPEEQPYYYPMLLIKMLVFGNNSKKKDLLEAYIDNDREYVLNEICKNFGLNRKNAANLFLRAQNYSYDKTLKEGLKKDIKKVVHNYYARQSQNFKNKYNDFEQKTLKSFKGIME